MDESYRDEIYKNLYNNSNGLIREIRGEVHYYGKELNTWILVNKKEDIPQLYKIYAKEINKIRNNFKGTKFYASFTQLDGDYLVYWDSYDADVLSPTIPDDWDSFPQREKISELDKRIFYSLNK